MQAFPLKPTSKEFIARMKEIELTTDDFLQVFVEVEGCKRDLLATVAEFGPSPLAQRDRVSCSTW